MLRVMNNLDLRTNLNLCGVDRPFCYPVTDVGDVAFYYKLPPGEWGIYSINLYTQDFGSLIHIFYVAPTNFVNQYFSYIIAQDSNGDNFIVIRQMQPFYNYDGLQSEVTCFSLGVTLNSDDGEYTIGTEPVCYVAQRTMNHYVILGAIEDIATLAVTIKCGTDDPGTIYHYDDLPTGYWIEYTGPFIDLFVPEGCEVTLAVVDGVEVNFDFTTQLFGAQNCMSYAKLTGNAKFKYDCMGRYFGVIDDDDIEIDNMTHLLINEDSELDMGNFPIVIAGASTKELASRSTPKRVSPSCYIPNDEWFNRYRIASNCPVPGWFVQEVNNVASTQAVTVAGTQPIVDDYNTYIPILQSDEYTWKEYAQEIKGSRFFLPNLYFESCICYRNFVC